ncbi:cAMP dependent protein kinase regulatory subunit [Parasitella parasitica]|nr:cAMP dependent protein kinase regulatory subunit [Parasitella parasitica]
MPDSVHPFSTQPASSQEYQNLIHELNQQVKQRNPEDTLQFCFDFFLQKLLEERSQNRSHQSTTSDSQTGGINPYAKEQEIHALHKVDEDEDMVSDHLPNFQKNTNLRNRRVSVSAESLQPTQKTQKKKIPKPQAEIDMITSSLQCHFLYKTLEEDQRQDVIDCMEEKRFRKGDVVIEQGAVGDFFYIVSSGTLDCYVDNTLVTRYERSGNFGELALMYNAPRAATIKATSDVILWALDRVSFRSILMDHNSKKRLMHEEFLKGVPLFQSLELAEMHKIADALEPVSFHDKEVVLNQGDAGENFYLIERGHALFYKTENGGQFQLVNEMKHGDYFGELALLTDKPRAATVVAKGDLKCVTLGKAAFTRLLGPVMDILKRNSVNYHAILQEARS